MKKQYDLTEKRISGKTIYNGRILNLEVDEIVLPDNSHSIRECVRHCGGAAVLLIQDKKVLLVKQFRYLYGKPIYELPAGKLNEGEDGAIAAARELEEETGYRAELKPYLKLYPSPGYTDEIINIYFAKNFKFVGQKLDDGEFLDCEFIDLDTVLQMIERGEICDAKTVSAIYKYISDLK